MITIGDVCPIFFDVLKYEHANKGSFRQCFDLDDGILIQVLCDNNEIPKVFLKDKINSSCELFNDSPYNTTSTSYISFLPHATEVTTSTVAFLLFNFNLITQ